MEPHHDTPLSSQDIASNLTNLLTHLNISTLSPQAKRDWRDIACWLEEYMPTNDADGTTVVEGDVGQMRQLLRRIEEASERAIEVRILTITL